MIKIGLAATNDAAGLDNKNVSAFIQHRQEKLSKLSKIAEIMFRYSPKATEAET